MDPTREVHHGHRTFKAFPQDPPRPEPGPEPGGGADWAYEDNPLEKVYFVLEGEMTVTDKDGNVYVIHANESISFPPNEGRGLKNESDKPAKMLVIINYPEN